MSHGVCRAAGCGHHGLHVVGGWGCRRCPTGAPDCEATAGARRCESRRALGRRRGRRVSGEGGSAVVEFVYLGVLMLVPLIYLVMMMSRLQAGAFATTQAAREAGRAFVTTSAADTAEARANAAARIAFEDQGFRDGTSLVIDCDGLPCLRPEGRVETTATVTVPLPLVPSFARRLVPLEVPVTARHLSTVDRFRNAP